MATRSANSKSAAAAAKAKPATEVKEDLNPFRIAMNQFDRAAKRLKLDPGLLIVTRRPLVQRKG